MRIAEIRQLMLTVIVVGMVMIATFDAQADRVVLDRPTIVVDPNQPSYVQYASRTEPATSRR